MTALEFILAAVVVATTAAVVDYMHARYALALVGTGSPHIAARWSVAQGIAGSIGFVIAVKYTLWVLPFEALGWYLGTYLGRNTEGPGSAATLHLCARDTSGPHVLRRHRDRTRVHRMA